MNQQNLAEVTMQQEREFRLLNSNEKAVIVKAAKNGRGAMPGVLFDSIDRLEVSYEFMQGGFCICLIRLLMTTTIGNVLYQKLIFRGASRRSYKDPRKPIRGEMLAFSRAVLYSRPVEV